MVAWRGAWVESKGKTRGPTEKLSDASAIVFLCGREPNKSIRSTLLPPSAPWASFLIPFLLSEKKTREINKAENCHTGQRVGGWGVGGYPQETKAPQSCITMEYGKTGDRLESVPWRDTTGQRHHGHRVLIISLGNERETAVHDAASHPLQKQSFGGDEIGYIPMYTFILQETRTCFPTGRYDRT